VLGVGIPKNEATKLFKKFSRIDNELSHQVGGTGLGLYLVKSIIDLHRGAISVHSVPGSGTTMTVSLPGESQGEK
jgi:signal transduction histidine kinase